MNQRFLCPNHRSWLQTNPMAANAQLSDAKDTGQWYREQGLWHEAIPFLGSAYEAAEIVLSIQGRDKATAIINFTSCAILLADTWHKLGEGLNSQGVFKEAQQRLVPEHALCYQQPQLQACVTDCIKALNTGFTYEIESHSNRMCH